MKEILQTIILNLVDNKDAVTINELASEKTITYEVKLASEDMGKIIGKQGKTAQAIRTIAKSLASKEHKRVVIEFIG